MYACSEHALTKKIYAKAKRSEPSHSRLHQHREPARARRVRSLAFPLLTPARVVAAMRAAAAAARVSSAPPLHWPTTTLPPASSGAAHTLQHTRSPEISVPAEPTGKSRALASSGSTTAGSSSSSSPASPTSPASPRSAPSSPAFASAASLGVRANDESGRSRENTGNSLPVRRTATKRPGFDYRHDDNDIDYSVSDAYASRREKKLLKLALANSLVETQWAKARVLPQARVFHPTVEEFADPIQYIGRYGSVVPTRNSTRS